MIHTYIVSFFISQNSILKCIILNYDKKIIKCDQICKIVYKNIQNEYSM